MPWCPRCGTGISEHEIVTEGYQERTHLSIYVAFPLRDEPGANLLVWTTTPWTLAANVAAAVHPELTTFAPSRTARRTTWPRRLRVSAERRVHGNRAR